MSVCIIRQKTKKEIETAIQKSKTLKGTLNLLGYNIGKNTNICEGTKKVFYETCEKLNIDVSKIRYNIPKHKRNKKCFTCGKKLTYDNKTGYCLICLKEKKIATWLKEGTKIAPQSRLSKTLRDYIFEQQNGKCSICGMINEWNGKHLNFILDHINGDASNNNRNNLRLICPNCDSQLDTFKSKNKCSARKYRHKYL